ncbi:MAG: hypothetical protein K2F63_02285 [Muribaculaceae bacterium]|nr:hypothetical protein [Muribaculaceae bacterium]MDE6133976.1 hypothetical protein [Muribaculaceae bacterium]
MSKISLKKELDKLDREQLVELILDAYSSSKETKDYFDFFLNPDADALVEKYVNIISKEINRSKRGYSKARITYIRNALKRFEGFGTGPDYVGRIIYYTIRMLVGQERYIRYTPTLTKGMYKLVADYIKYADANGFVSDALNNIDRMTKETQLGRPPVREAIRKAIADLINSDSGQ